MTHDDDAALIARAKAYADEARRIMAEINADAPIYATHIDALAAALEAALAREGLLREVLENIAWATPEKTAFAADDLWAVLSASAIAALAPDAKEEDKG